MLLASTLDTFGDGGSILTMAALVELFGQNPHGVLRKSLVPVGEHALIGAWLHQHAAYGSARRSRLLSGRFC